MLHTPAALWDPAADWSFYPESGRHMYYSDGPPAAYECQNKAYQRDCLFLSSADHH